jgi:type II secretory pathway pseudopilin PulG
VNRSRGYTYLTVLFVVAIMASGLAVIGEMWQTVAQREREAELLHIGNEYRKAIERYYLAGPAQYPRNLADLVKDPRQAGTVRHLRRLYPDPITGKAEWKVIPAAQGGIAGVSSSSEDKPLKSAGFRVRDASFEGKSKYSDWQFIFAPEAAAAATSVPAKPAAPSVLR